MSQPETVRVSPAMMIGALGADGKATISPEATDLLDRLLEHMIATGKSKASNNYIRHVRTFFSWAEKQGHTIRALPADSVESFLSALRTAGAAETTLYIMRTQIRSSLQMAHEFLGADFGHISYQTGKPKEVHRQQKERNKQKNRALRQEQTIAQAQAILAARESGAGMPRPDFPEYDFQSSRPIDSPAASGEEHQMAQQSAAEPGSGSGGGGHQGPTPIIVQMPTPNMGPPPPQRPLATIGGGRPASQPISPARAGVLIANHTFTGPYVRVARLEDGTNPLTPPGTETYVTTVPLAQLAPHGDVAAYLQKFIIPNLPLAALTSQVHFVLAELNDRRQPTGRRDELVVGRPLSGHAAVDQPMGQPAGSAFNGYGQPPPPPAPSASDYWVQRLDADAAEAKKRAEALEAKLQTEKDSHTSFMLMQAMQRENDLRRELEQQKRDLLDRASREAQFAMMQPSAPMPAYIPEPPRHDGNAELMRAIVEGQGRLVEAVMSRASVPAPAADPMATMLPFIAQMNQQSQAIQQSNQQMLMQVMQSNQQFMQAMLGKQLQEVQAAAGAPKVDELESFAEKLQKMKMVSDMLGGGGGGGTSLIGELIANSESIGAGIAKVIESTQAKPVAPVQALPAVPVQALPAAKGPPKQLVDAHTLLVSAVRKQDDEQTITQAIEMLRVLTELPDPFPKLAERLLNAFKTMEDPAEMYVFAKSFWELIQQKPEKELVKQLSECLVRWYDVVHEQLFGTKKALGAELPAAEPVEEDETDEEGAEGEDEEGDEEDETGEIEEPTPAGVP